MLQCLANTPAETFLNQHKAANRIQFLCGPALVGREMLAKLMGGQQINNGAPHGMPPPTREELACLRHQVHKRAVGWENRHFLTDVNGKVYESNCLGMDDGLEVGFDLPVPKEVGITQVEIISDTIVECTCAVWHDFRDK